MIICKCGKSNLDLEGLNENITVYVCEDCGCFIEVDDETGNYEIIEDIY